MIIYIYNQMFYLQEYGILLGGCLTLWRISGGIIILTGIIHSILHNHLVSTFSSVRQASTKRI